MNDRNPHLSFSPPPCHSWTPHLLSIVVIMMMMMMMMAVLFCLSLFVPGSCSVERPISLSVSLLRRPSTTTSRPLTERLPPLTHHSPTTPLATRSPLPLSPLSTSPSLSEVVLLDFEKKKNSLKNSD
ncbi:hypothetical protein CAOG_010109 [Capsaspora owczarzaki ATCC 30864]|uniref:Uncharacterized protein n=1 Tax=Capsaspora owczarzaki (strain ATCC 30864) TaxID=595528 RepID=A0A0D2WX63_CAPO3|nr:hypothetical protein CAOG_010109 [Capsaspora owczarzaki ATCC 30864]